MGGILSQYTHISNHHDMHFKYLTILFVNYTAIELGKKEEKDPFSYGLKCKYMCTVICHLILLMIPLVVQTFFFISTWMNLPIFFLLWQLGFVLCFKRPSSL